MTWLFVHEKHEVNAENSSFSCSEPRKNIQHTHADTTQTISSNLRSTHVLWAVPIHIWCDNFPSDFISSPPYHYFTTTRKLQTSGLLKRECSIYCSIYVSFNQLTCAILYYYFHQVPIIYWCITDEGFEYCAQSHFCSPTCCGFYCREEHIWCTGQNCGIKLN